jgi:hypothetical protein
MSYVLVIDSNLYKPTQCTVASNDSSFVELIKVFLQSIADERLSGASNYQNIKQFITNCTTASQLSDINTAFINPLVSVKWYILQSSVEARVEVPIEAPIEAPVEAPVELTIEPLEELPVEAPVEVPPS